MQAYCVMYGNYKGIEESPYGIIIQWEKVVTGGRVV